MTEPDAGDTRLEMTADERRTDEVIKLIRKLRLDRTGKRGETAKGGAGRNSVASPGQPRGRSPQHGLGPFLTQARWPGWQ